MQIESKEIFANNLKYYMNKKGIDRNTLCSDLDLKYTTVRDWLKGITYPRIGKIELLANYFGINKSDLIESKNVCSTPSTTIVQAINDTVIQLEEPRQEKVLTFADKQLKEQKSENSSIAEPLTEYHVFEKLSAGNGYDYMEDRNYDVVFYNKDIDLSLIHISYEQYKSK